MQEERDIKWLKSKIWYRLLKVAYIMIFILIFVGSNLGVAAEKWPEKTLNLLESKFICNNGKQANFISEGIEELYEVDAKDKDMRWYCSDVDVFTQDYKTFYAPINYKVVINYYKLNMKDWLGVLWAIPLASVIVFFLFELGRRLFYYIFLGTFFPKKR